MGDGLLNGELLLLLSGLVNCGGNLITGLGLLGLLDGGHVLLDRFLGLGLLGGNGDLEGSSGGFLNGKFSFFIKLVLVDLS